MACGKHCSGCHGKEGIIVLPRLGAARPFFRNHFNRDVQPHDPFVGRLKEHIRKLFGE